MEARKTGIDILGNKPWGTHFCQFYQTKNDLIDILVPYFKAGLENNEFCMWVTSEPLNVEETKESLRKAVKDLDKYIKKGQIEILDYSQWYTKAGKFEQDRVLQGWVKKEKEAIKKGFDGLRLTGNTFWLEKKDWKSFADYEEVVNNVIGKYKMLAICTYSLEKCNLFKVLDVVKNHQFALIQRAGKWEIIESAELRKAEEELRENEEKYRDLWENVNDLIQSVKPDGTFVYVNRAWRETLGYNEKEIPDLSLLDIIHPDSHAHCMEIFKRLLAGEKVEYIEAAFLAKDGKTIMVEGSANCRFVDGKPVTTRAIFRDVTERKKVEKRKSEFLSHVSHALRTPLASIKSFVEILLKYKDVNPTEQSEFLTVINNETDRLTRLINQLLDLDKIEQDELKWKFVSCDISNIVQNAISELEPLIQEKNIVVNMNLPSQDLIVNGDKDRLNEVFINLIGNAIKFTPSKREIRITVKNKGKVVEVSIADTGIGIPKDELTNIFERFKRLDNSINRKLTGTGLGLYICKQIIEKHEGKIWAESHGSKGAKFIFVLPKYKAKSTKKRIEPKRGS
ncbi:MAG: MEDS domain-containing protein [bacterium]|nr:MEDS domain-containing protein [bacterium]